MSNDRKMQGNKDQHRQQTGGSGHGETDRQHEQAGGKMGQAGGAAGGAQKSAPAKHESGKHETGKSDPKGGAQRR